MKGEGTSCGEFKDEITPRVFTNALAAGGGEAKRAFERTQPHARARPKASELAGRQGFEFGEKRFSKLVMARDFWC